MAVVAFKARLVVHAVARRAVALAAVREVGIGIHFFRALGDGFVGLVAGKARFLGGRLERAVLVAHVAGESRMRAGDLHGRRGLNRKRDT